MDLARNRQLYLHVLHAAVGDWRALVDRDPEALNEAVVLVVGVE